MSADAEKFLEMLKSDPTFAKAVTYAASQAAIEQGAAQGLKFTAEDVRAALPKGPPSATESATGWIVATATVTGAAATAAAA